MKAVMAFLKRKGVSLSAKKYFVDAFSAMAMGQIGRASCRERVYVQVYI